MLLQILFIGALQIGGAGLNCLHVRRSGAAAQPAVERSDLASILAQLRLHALNRRRDRIVVDFEASCSRVGAIPIFVGRRVRLRQCRGERPERQRGVFVLAVSIRRFVVRVIRHVEHLAICRWRFVNRLAGRCRRVNLLGIRLRLILQFRLRILRPRENFPTKTKPPNGSPIERASLEVDCQSKPQSEIQNRDAEDDEHHDVAPTVRIGSRPGRLIAHPGKCRSSSPLNPRVSGAGRL